MMPPLTPAELAAADALIDLALAEDLGDRGDITSEATIPADARGDGRFAARQPGVVAGLTVVARLAERMGFLGTCRTRPGRDVLADASPTERGSTVEPRRSSPSSSGRCGRSWPSNGPP